MKRICSLSLLSIAAVSALSCSQERKEKPNVLFIAIDDLNDWVGELGGNPQVKTTATDTGDTCSTRSRKEVGKVLDALEENGRSGIIA